MLCFRCPSHFLFGVLVCVLAVACLPTTTGASSDVSPFAEERLALLRGGHHEEDEEEEKNGHDGRRRRRELGTLVCGGGSTSGDVLYNAVIKVRTASPASCSSSQANEIESFVDTKFDGYINQDPLFRNHFQLQTDFCNNNNNRRRRLLNDDDDTDDDPHHNHDTNTEDLFVLAEHDIAKRDEVVAEEEKNKEEEKHEVEDLRNSSSPVSVALTTHYEEEEEEEEEERRRRRKMSVLVVRLSSRGRGLCHLCRPDDSDQRRRLVDDETYFYRETKNMELEIERQLSTDLYNNYHFRTGHCLKGKNPSAEVHLLVVGSTGSQTQCSVPNQSVYCCAPESAPWDVCSKAVFGDSWHCHEFQQRCEGVCGGYWVDAMNPPANCLGLWADDCAESTKPCCPGFRCNIQSQWYSQCVKE